MKSHYKRCSKCVKACEEKALTDVRGETYTEFNAKLCTCYDLGCAYCIIKYPFYDKGYDYVKERYDKLEAKLAEKRKN